MKSFSFGKGAYVRSKKRTLDNLNDFAVDNLEFDITDSPVCDISVITDIQDVDINQQTSDVDKDENGIGECDDAIFQPNASVNGVVLLNSIPNYIALFDGCKVGQSRVSPSPPAWVDEPLFENSIQSAYTWLGK